MQKEEDKSHCLAKEQRGVLSVLLRVTIFSLFVGLCPEERIGEQGYSSPTAAASSSNGVLHESTSTPSMLPICMHPSENVSSEF